MKLFNRIVISAAGLAGAVSIGPAYAASDVANSQTTASQAVASVAAPVASAQTAGLIGSAVGSAVGGAVGGSVGGAVGGSVGGAVGGGGGGAVGGGGVAPGKLFNTREAGRAGGAEPRKFGVWAQGTYVNIHKSEVSLGMDGNVVNTMAGMDYRLTNRVLVGLAAGYENVDIKTKFNSGTYKVDGFTVAPYLGVTINQNWFADGSFGFSWLNYDVSRNNNAVKGNFDGTRSFVSANLTGMYALNRWQFSPKFGVLYLKERQDSYVETGGAQNIGQLISFGQASAGLKTGYAFDGFTPYARLTGQWDFTKPSAVLKGNGQMSAVDDFGGVAALGVDIGGAGQWSGSIEGAYGSIGRSDLDIWQGSAKVRYVF